MAKICFPHFCKGEFASLADALKFLNRKSYTSVNSVLCDIVQYNICYRDYLRSYGIEKLIERLVEEAPQLREKKAMLHCLREWAKTEKLADYDIQCYNINDKVAILGHTFDGLDDIKEHVELYGHVVYNNLYSCWSDADVDVCDDVHIGHFYDNYPIFDSSDLCDNRTYQNYIFRTKALSECDMKEAFQMFSRFNFCMVHENIPEDKLPILYYRGEGNYMLLATKKE